ncbi:MAG TPA: prepilin-type N-terminal cleavage/methylation domain-containing protein [Candidatus Limnocylindrales bacterium]|nr:prepilin-type N-terminal cleavage/methylation domain-containing protein [Candidatus Limnocylindrales bacterium]
MRLKRDDRGVTLIEVLVAVTLLAIIMFPLTNAMITYLRNTNATNDRLAASHDAQIAAAFFAQDVQSIGVRDWDVAGFALKQSVELNVAPHAGLHQCGPAGATTPNAVVRMAWDDPAAATGRPPKVVVSYVVAGRELHRWHCAGGAFRDTMVAHNLDSVSAPQCVPSCSDPQSLSMDLTIRVLGNTTDVLTVKLFGQRRQTS